jgi:hypothetical protein
MKKQIKLNNKVAAAVAAKSAKQVKGKNPKAKAAKIAKAKVGQLPDGKADKLDKTVAVLSGERGFAARMVERAVYGTRIFIRALQNNLGLPLKDGLFCEVTDSGLQGERAALVECGGYVNGKTKGAKVRFMSAADFQSKAAKAVIHWNADDNGIHGFYVGNPAQKGMCAVCVNYNGQPFFWQMETDSNSNNKHERGKIEAAKTGGKLIEVNL